MKNELNNNIRIWAYKSVGDSERSYISIPGYDDEVESKYVYDNSVANSKQMSNGDVVILVNKEVILGVSRIARITSKLVDKTRHRCPECGSTNYTDRSTKSPRYRCNKGHEFEYLKEDTSRVTQYEAKYGDNYINLVNKNISIAALRPFYINNYNRNMSIQRIGEEVTEEVLKLDMNSFKSSLAFPEISDGDTETEYVPEDTDEREKVFRAIKKRRGQKSFRDGLRKRYGDKCMITSCTIMHIVDAAHISAYRGPKDNNVQNGLLLRTDIHTLFDLDLLGIDPNGMTIEISQELKGSKYEHYNGTKLKFYKAKPSLKALQKRWDYFRKVNL